MFLENVENVFDILHYVSWDVKHDDWFIYYCNTIAILMMVQIFIIIIFFFFVAG